MPGLNRSYCTFMYNLDRDNSNAKDTVSHCTAFYGCSALTDFACLTPPPTMTHQLHFKPTNKLLSHRLPNASASLDTESSWLSTKSWFSLHQRCSNMCWCDVTFSLGHAFVGYSCQLFKHVTSCPVTRRRLSRCDKTLQDWMRQLRDLKWVFYIL